MRRGAVTLAPAVRMRPPRCHRQATTLTAHGTKLGIARHQAAPASLVKPYPSPAAGRRDPAPRGIDLQRTTT